MEIRSAGAALRRTVRGRISPWRQRQVRSWQVAVRRPTANYRQQPSFVIVGAMRAGTTSLFRYLTGHPDVLRPARKEIDYFSTTAYGFGLDWYLAHFPLRRQAGISFEATPQYLLHPLAAERMARQLPDCTVVVCLRDPAARLRSQHRWMSTLGFESLPLDEALAREPERIDDELARAAAGTLFHPHSLFRFGYLARSMYAQQLERFEQHFAGQIHVFDFERFRRSPQAEFAALLGAVGLDPWTPDGFVNWSPRPGSPDDDPWVGLADDVRSRLAEDWRVTRERWLPDDVGDRHPVS